MTQRYVAFLRGVNVGGKAKLKMADLASALTKTGLSDVQTYIQSGNVLFSSDKTDKQALAKHIQKVIADDFQIDTSVAIFSQSQWKAIVKVAPKWWGKDTDWKHNLLILTQDIPASDIVTAIGKLKPDIEAIKAGQGVVYQSMSFSQFGKTVTGKLASHPLYKAMTIRNFNTATKLLARLEDS